MPKKKTPGDVMRALPFYLLDRTRTFGGHATVVNERYLDRPTPLQALEALERYLKKALKQCQADIEKERTSERGVRELRRRARAKKKAQVQRALSM